MIVSVIFTLLSSSFHLSTLFSYKFSNVLFFHLFLASNNLECFCYFILSISLIYLYFICLSGFMSIYQYSICLSCLSIYTLFSICLSLNTLSLCLSVYLYCIPLHISIQRFSTRIIHFHKSR